MPKGILTQFIVAVHHLIASDRFVWKSGVILRKDGTAAEVIAHNAKREVTVRVAGKRRKELLAIVTFEMDRIHGSYKRLKYVKREDFVAGEVFISYAWGGESEQIVNKLDKSFQARNVTIIRDKRDLGFKGRIQAFMEQIGRGQAVIVVISDKYLKSPNCMFELVQIAKNGHVYDRIFPIVLADAQIYKPVERIKYIQHWEQQIGELDEAMKTVSSANLQGFREEIDQYTEIRNTMAELTHLLKDMNTFTPEMHRQSGFAELFEAVERKLAE